MADMRNLKMVGYACPGGGPHVDAASELLASRGPARRWDRVVVRGTDRMLLSLARNDPKAAGAAIDLPRARHRRREDRYLDGCVEWRHGAANYLLGAYHVATAVNTAAKHRRGSGTATCTIRWTATSAPQSCIATAPATG